MHVGQEEPDPATGARTAAVPDDVVRLSVGVEDPGDILADPEQAIATATE